MTSENVLVPWLDDAHAMEHALVQVFEAHFNQAAEQPVVAARLEEHIAATRRHELAIKGCIERLAHRPSVLKAGAGSILGTLQTLSTGILGDAVLRNFLADYAAQKYQIAFYKVVMAAAADMGDVTTLQTCQEILREEQDMAAWIEREIPTVVRDTLRQKAASR